MCLENDPPADAGGTQVHLEPASPAIPTRDRNDGEPAAASAESGGQEAGLTERSSPLLLDHTEWGFLYSGTNEAC